jgi:cellulose biosynthesis protein BcsQ
LPDDQYDLIVFDCPPAIGYQSLNAAFAADILYIPSGPGYWEYDSTTSYLGQLGDALEDITSGFERIAQDAGITLPKRFDDIRVLMTRFEASNSLHVAMMDAFKNVFGADVCQNPIEMTRAVEQSGRFQMSVYEQDYRQMTRDTWKRARQSFDNAYSEFKDVVLRAWEARTKIEERVE